MNPLSPFLETLKNHLLNTVWPALDDSYMPEQPEATYNGTPIPPSTKGLPKIVESLCPECEKTRCIPARMFEEEGKVFMEKTCPEHGYFKELYWSDVEMFLRAEKFSFGDNRGLSNPRVPHATKCPQQCGLCNMHTSHTGVGNLDLTNRCNLTCPVCFANANAAGYVYQPTLDDVRKMILSYRAERPTPGHIIQFSGGEPTIYPHFIEACRLAKDLGISWVQVASNGIAFTDPEFAFRAKEAGLDGIYLQFDGMVDAIYKKTRGESLFKKKLQAIENAGKADLYVVLVCTVVRGVNNHQVGEILKFGIEHCDTVSGVAFQPVTFTGRIAQRMRERMRYTLSDLAHDVEEQTGLAEAREDWFPIPCTSPFAKLFDALRGDGSAVNFSCHSHCGQGTYLYVDKNGGATPMTRFIDAPGFLRAIDSLAGKVSQSSSPTLAIARLLANLRRFWRADKAPPGLTFSHFLHLLKELVEGRPEHGARRSKGDELFMACGMHFMDSYNYEVERVKRCIIHYSAPNGLIYPFCTYNSGPVYREKVEKKFAMSMEQWKNQGAVKYTENIDKITKDVRVAERKKAETAVVAATPATATGCCSGDGNGQAGGCGCSDSHGNGQADGKHEALLQLLPEVK